ncbi:hypothetical protein ISS08_02195 [Candidatus Pacearchaeota archaeon]|nr:hypothetical protein [Candidatus Pacearchaeota archaeon]
MKNIQALADDREKEVKKNIGGRIESLQNAVKFCEGGGFDEGGDEPIRSSLRSYFKERNLYLERYGLDFSDENSKIQEILRNANLIMLYPKFENNSN